MNPAIDRAIGREHRHRRIRKKVAGWAERPRLDVYRSHKQLYVQIIDDIAGKTLLGRSTKDERLKHLKTGGNLEAAKQLGKLVAEEALKQGITRVVFDRGGYQYHGRVKALAEAAREGGLQF